MRCRGANLNMLLEHAQLLGLEQARGCLIRCEEGALSLSGPAPVGDVELRAGAVYTVPTQALVLLQAWRSARISVTAPVRRPFWQRFGRRA